MEVNKTLHDQFMEVIDKGLKQNDPSETKNTLEGLLQAGYSQTDAKKYIGQRVALEIFAVMKNGEMFNEERYVRNLQNLPGEPVE